tara:strand:- start:286 stop:1488 length:1203 start_codon:yes stop_codon:yes gene_type:complete
MATYVNNLRLKEIATGDESGTWGTSTNTNLSLIGEALGYNTQDCFSSDADATTTVADGSSDPARAFYFKVTSSATLSATRTLTLLPNTVSRVMIIENATTGSQSINISQGSGANVTIASGATKVIYTDGAGSGASVYDALEDTNLGGTPTMTNLTVTSSVTADSVTAPTLTGSTSVKTPLIEYTDGDDAITIADGGGITAAAGITSTAAANTFGATSFNDADITNVGNISVDSVKGDADSDTAITFSTDDTVRFTCGGTSQLIISDGAILPETNNDIDLGSSSLQFKDGYFDGTLNTDGIVNSGAIYSGSFVYSSDVSLKEDIQTIENPLEKVQQLRGVSYKWKDTGRKDIGLVADEVQEVLPELVVEKGHKHIDYGHMIGLLVEAMKEQQKEIEELKNA